MKKTQWLTLAVVACLLIMFNPYTNPRAKSSFQAPINEDIAEARSKFQEAYNATVEAERTGTEVSQAVRELNGALDQIFQAENLAAQGDLEKAFLSTQACIQLSEDILTLTEELKQRAEALRYTRLITYGSISAVLIILGIYAFFIGRRIWRRHQRNKFMEMRLKETLESK
jgi:uncharacterized membrane protein